MLKRVSFVEVDIVFLRYNFSVVKSIVFKDVCVMVVVKVNVYGVGVIKVSEIFL